MTTLTDSLPLTRGGTLKNRFVLASQKRRGTMIDARQFFEGALYAHASFPWCIHSLHHACQPALSAELAKNLAYTRKPFTMQPAKATSIDRIS